MPTNDKLIAHGRIGLALKIIKQQSTMDIILENIQTGVRGLNDDKILERRAFREGERGRSWSSNNNNKLATPPTTHINASATGEREDGDMDRTASIFTAEYWVG